MSQPNQNQIDFWNGNAGSQWVNDQAYLDALLEPLSRHAISAAAVGGEDRVLDIGCGCGTTSLLLAQQATQTTGIDISGPMVERATVRSHAQQNVEFIQADASRWRGEQLYQLAFSRFGVMFFDDPVGAFANIRHNLSEDGRLCFICWRTPKDNPWLSIATAAAEPFLPDAPPTEGPDPFAFADTEFVTGVLTNAGFNKPEFALCEETLNLGQNVENAIGFLARLGPLSRVTSELEGESQQQALAAVRQVLEPAVTDSGVELGASCWIVRTKVGSG